MKYYVTIYIDKLLEQELWDTNFKDFTHAFLGLTKGKSPDELDKQDEMLRQEKLKNKEWDKIDQKWYESLETNEYNDGFFGFGTGTSSFFDTAGKVFENNHYVMDNNVKTNIYEIKKLRSKQSFNSTNRCTLEISQEQYEFLLNEIQKDLETTKDIKPQSLEAVNEKFNYHITNNNCTTWLLHKLDSIGIEVFNIKEYIPDIPVLDDLKELFPYLTSCNTTFLKFQNIDDNLKSIKGAKAFKQWARTFINHPCFHQFYIENNSSLKDMDLDQEQKDLLLKIFFNVKEIYSILNTILQTRLDKIDSTNIKGNFELIYFDKEENKIKVLKVENDYNPITIENFDLSIPANNCSVSKFYPFIFIPQDKILSRMLYHKYDYGKVSKNYQHDANEFYKNVLAGIQSDKYWSLSYHKLLKQNTQFQAQTKKIENA